jgi:hypothetical protein
MYHDDVPDGAGSSGEYRRHLGGHQVLGVMVAVASSRVERVTNTHLAIDRKDQRVIDHLAVLTSPVSEGQRGRHQDECDHDNRDGSEPSSD